ncbi:roadblock/LC7 domain-containing protein [Streptomyces sp. NBC_01498]|uniref:roadblock/LC7 domain-containing protein n=1 Tax=Streptomyces sp. NBC_01498 TaxID=2975870 RepID=UPI002E7C5515|nr:roadblock/LC7 domain-containing protein [Streptomyces sp. NBC_01498]WTL26119.1 roadblock/LC7 domain-containing protein [Streptomyces sp. NBC_01498]
MDDTRTSDALVEVLTTLRDTVAGVGESVISTGDGLLVAADADAVHPESIAALAAAALGVGRRLAEQANTGPLRDVVTRCAGGHIMVLAIGDRALLTLVGDEGLDIVGLQRVIPTTIEQLEKLLAADGG